MRPPVDDIPIPPLPAKLPWVNVATLRIDQQHGRPVVIDFWDFCRVNSLRTLPYLRGWHERYAELGLRIIGVHAAGFPCSEDPEAVRAAVERLGIEYPVVVDERLEIWDLYGNRGWPGRYVFGPDLLLRDLHYGEGAYRDTELLIQELLGVEREPLAPVRPEDAPGALVVQPTPDQPGAYSGPYAAGGVHAVLDGSGTVRVDGREVAVDGPGAYPLVEHARHTAGEIAVEAGPGVECHATCFTAGLAPEQPPAPPPAG